MVTCLVLHQQSEMMQDFLRLWILLQTAFWGNVGLKTYYGFYARLPRLVIKLYGAVHIAMVSQGQGTHTQFLCPVNEVVYPAGPVQEAVFTMDMEVDKISTHRFRSPLKYYIWCW